MVSGPLLGSVHVLPLMFEDLSRGEAQVFITDVAVVNSGEAGCRGGARLPIRWL